MICDMLEEMRSYCLLVTKNLVAILSSSRGNLVLGASACLAGILFFCLQVPTVVVSPLFTNLGFVHLNHALMKDGHADQDLAEAEEYYLQALMQDSRNAHAILGLGKSYLEQGRYDQAIGGLEMGIKAYPRDTRLHLALGDAYYGMGNPTVAIQEWRTSSATAELSVRGDMYKARGELEKAAYWYTAYTEAEPSSANAYYNLGTVRLAQGMIPEAIVALQRAVALAPEDPFIRHQLGLVYMSQGAAAEAIHEFEQVVRIRPDDPWTNIYLSTLYLAQDKWDQAALSAQKAIAFSQHPRPHFVLGSVYRHQGLMDQAIGEYKLAVQLAPAWNKSSPYSVDMNEVVEYHLALARAYRETKQPQAAISVYNIILSMDPANKSAAEELRLLEQPAGK